MSMHDTGRSSGKWNAVLGSGVRLARKHHQHGPIAGDGYNEPFRYGEIDDQPYLDRAVLDAHYAAVEFVLADKT